jgi:hypothetical protein
MKFPRERRGAQAGVVAVTIDVIQHHRCARLVKRANGASILPFIRKAGIVFDDRVTKVIGEAFDNACRELPTEQSMIVHEVIAKRIIDAAENGERDLVRLRSAGLTALRFDDDDKEAS